MAIIADFRNDETKVYTKAVYQYDKGQRLIIAGIALPENYEVHVSNNPNSGIAAAYSGNIDGVFIPDAYFSTGEYVYIWLYKMEGVTSSEPSSSDIRTVKSGETIYEIVVPVIKRPVQLPVTYISPEGTIGYMVEDGVLVPVRQ